MFVFALLFLKARQQLTTQVSQEGIIDLKTFFIQFCDL